jgi:hypothetical protein
MPSIRLERPRIHEIGTPEQALDRVRKGIKRISGLPDYQNFGSGYLRAVQGLNKLRAQLEFDHRTHTRLEPLVVRRELVFKDKSIIKLPDRRVFKPLPGEIPNISKAFKRSGDVWMGSTLLRAK